jgi:hypothetical protein
MSFRMAVFEDALATVAYFMSIKPSCAFITTFQHRSATQTIAPLLQRFGLHAEVVRSGSHYCHLFPEGNTAIASVSVIEIVTKTKHAQGQYARDGYTVLEGVLTADMLAAIHSESDRLCAAIPSERCTSSACYYTEVCVNQCDCLFLAGDRSSCVSC